MILTEMPEIDAAIAEESWEFLCDRYPVFAAAVAAQVTRGSTPEDIRRHMMAKTHGLRPEIALRMMQAAEHLLNEAGE